MDENASVFSKLEEGIKPYVVRGNRHISSYPMITKRELIFGLVPACP